MQGSSMLQQQQPCHSLDPHHTNLGAAKWNMGRKEDPQGPLLRLGHLTRMAKCWDPPWLSKTSQTLHCASGS